MECWRLRWCWGLSSKTEPMSWSSGGSWFYKYLKTAYWIQLLVWERTCAQEWKSMSRVVSTGTRSRQGAPQGKNTKDQVPSSLSSTRSPSSAPFGRSQQGVSWKNINVVCRAPAQHHRAGCKRLRDNSLITDAPLNVLYIWRVKLNQKEKQTIKLNTRNKWT